ncbi:peptidylprolyl isomerase [Chitinilyticum aquatile]|uniref:peptidylprolyl isomerase n=1 Tax=Chitinilyticum aquatile TaxID=362520 RepID=UPI0004207866|nr:peptidylprolyl isomerase [Chitinilyticum aquatile]
MFKPNRITLAIAGSMLALSVTSITASAAVATVNGVAIPDSRMNAVVKQVTQRGQKDTPELRARIKEKLIQDEILAQEAVKRGLDKTADYQAGLDMAKQQLLIGALGNDLMSKAQVSDADVKKEYDLIKANMSPKKYKARHILVKTEAEADAILADLKKGKKFEELAKTKSLDKGSAVQGGSLGGPQGEWVDPKQFVPPFADALNALAKGQISKAPVKTEFGFHIIKADDVQENKVPEFKDVKEQLTQSMQQKAAQKQVEELTKKADVK